MLRVLPPTFKPVKPDLLQDRFDGVGGKTRTLPFNSFCSNVVRQVTRFSVPLVLPHPGSSRMLQNEAKCTTFLVKTSFICMRMKKSFTYQRLGTEPRFDTGARKNSEKAYCLRAQTQWDKRYIGYLSRGFLSPSI